MMKVFEERMSTTTETPDTLADVVSALGDTPIHRIIWRHVLDPQLNPRPKSQ